MELGELSTISWIEVLGGASKIGEIQIVAAEAVLLR